MIEFSGEPSGACKRYRLKTESLVGLICASVPAIIVAVPVIYAACVWNWIFAIAIPALAVFVVLAAIMPLKKPHDLLLPTSVRLQEDEIISESEKFYEVRKLSDVKNVVDMGEWYQINFFFPNKSARFVCQKSLITQGTIENFEKIFEGKLIRR